MEANEVQMALASAVEEVLETMCFTAVHASGEGLVPPEDNEPAPGFGGELIAELRFHGNPSGGFRVGVSMKLALTVAAAFLGLEEREVSGAQAGDVICELANMICGSVLSRLESTAAFRITHPELAPPGRGVSFEGACTNRWFDLGDGILTVSLELGQAVALGSGV